MEAWVSTKRVQRFLQLEELDWSKYYHIQCNVTANDCAPEVGSSFSAADENGGNSSDGPHAAQPSSDSGVDSSSPRGENGSSGDGNIVWIRDGCFTWRRKSGGEVRDNSAGQTRQRDDASQTGRTGEAGKTGSSDQRGQLEEPTACMLVDLNLSIKPVRYIFFLH